MSKLKLIKVIEKKRNGEVLSGEDIGIFVDAVLQSLNENANNFEAADRCQIGAMLMAMFLKGLNSAETLELTERMKMAGDVLDWPARYRPRVVDKHSTGGVGDKISLVLAPALAALGYKVPMVSGRSLKHTGGTLDKLESISGFQILLTKEQIEKQMETVGCCIVGQTENTCPVDRVLYQCREMTSTVECSPLIIASILSKKLSEGLDALVLDVKFGKGAFFKTKEEALDIAEKMLDASKSIKTAALITNMENPLGRTIGNSLEVLEALDCLKGAGPADVVALTAALGSELICLTEKTTRKEAQNVVTSTLKDGRALMKFYDMLIQQGVSKQVASELCYGNASLVLPKAPHETCIVYSGEEGYISGIDPLVLANLWKEEVDISRNNLGVGFTILKTVGEKIRPGDYWLRMHHSQENLTSSQETTLKGSLSISSTFKSQKLIEKRIYCAEKSKISVEAY